MSDSEGDFSDELLELAGAGEKRRKRASGKPQAKRRKASSPAVESEKEFESEEDDSNPYPLDGKFMDEADRHKLLEMPEIEREAILAQRLEELQHIQDKRNLDQMLRAQRGEADSVSKAAKRTHTVRGATKEKTRKLDELKARRKAKSDKKRTKASSPKRERSSSPMDMEMSSEEEEDGQISKVEQREIREIKPIPKVKTEEDEPDILDFESCRVSRDSVCKYSKFPWFEDFIKGSWVRFLIGSDKGKNVYRICEVASLGEKTSKPYQVDNEYMDHMLELKHGAAEKLFNAQRISNGPFTASEYDRLKATYLSDKLKLPGKRSLEKKAAQLRQLKEQKLTEHDVAAILASKAATKTRMSVAQVTLERSRLLQMRTLAQRRRDYNEVEEVDKKLAELNAQYGAPKEPESESEDVLAKVNERNRKANIEAVRRAEAAEAERKRRERKLALAAATSRSGTPKTLSHKLESNSRTTSPKGTPTAETTISGVGDTRPISPLPPLGIPTPRSSPSKRTFESIMAASIEIDLGDF